MSKKVNMYICIYTDDEIYVNVKQCAQTDNKRASRLMPIRPTLT